MEKMSNKERHEVPAKSITERQSFKLEFMKRTLEKFIWNKRHPDAGIKCYDLSSSKENQTREKSHSDGVGLSPINSFVSKP